MRERHEVLVTVRIGEITLRVRVTPNAERRARARLAAGQEVFAVIKTTACHHLR